MDFTPIKIFFVKKTLMEGPTRLGVGPGRSLASPDGPPSIVLVATLVVANREKRLDRDEALTVPRRHDAVIHHMFLGGVLIRDHDRLFV